MTTATRIRIVIGLLAGGWVALMASVHAAPAPERYPARPIRLVNPYAPGGLTDVVSRLLARHTTEAWGQQVIVDSRGGGGTTIGTEIVVRAPSDGYTMLCTTAALAMMPSFYPKLAFSTRKDLIPVALVSQVPGAIALNPNVPARSVRELIDLARAKPGQIAFGSAGSGSAQHLARKFHDLNVGSLVPRRVVIGISPPMPTEDCRCQSVRMPRSISAGSAAA